MILLGGCVLLFLSAVVAWLLEFFRERRIGASQTAGRQFPRLAHQICVGGCLLNLLFLIGLLTTLNHPYLAVREILPIVVPLLTLALLATIATVGAAVFTVIAWWKRHGSLAGRVHYTIVTLAMIAFVWWLDYWNLLGERF